jgi:hypothetical protein
MNDLTEYKWSDCVICGRSEKQYSLETGFAMLLWHTSKGPMCEFCVGEFGDKDELEDSE